MTEHDSKRLEGLKRLIDCFDLEKKDCEIIQVLWKDGGKYVIGNRDIIRKTFKLCADNLQKEIDALEGREPRKFRAVIINDEFAASTYEDGGIEALNEYCRDSYIDAIHKEYESEELLQAYLEGMYDIAGGDERAPANYLVITDEEEIKKLEI